MALVAVFFAILAAAAGVWYGRVQWSRRHRRRFLGIAGAHSYAYSADDPFNMIHTMDFDLFRRGRGGKIHNVMYGRTPGGHNVRGFEYRHVEASSNGRQTRRWTCACLDTGAQWPHLTLGPSGASGGSLGLITEGDLAFESDEFQAKWEVRSNDPRFAAALIDPELILFLLEKAEDASFEIAGPWLLYCTRQRDAEYLPDAMAFVDEFRSRIPPPVWTRYPPRNEEA